MVRVISTAVLADEARDLWYDPSVDGIDYRGVPVYPEDEETVMERRRRYRQIEDELVQGVHEEEITDDEIEEWLQGQPLDFGSTVAEGG